MTGETKIMVAERWFLQRASVALAVMLLAGFARGDFEIIDGWEHQLFPSYLISTATMRPISDAPSEEPVEEPDSAENPESQQEESSPANESTNEEPPPADEGAMEDDTLGEPTGIVGVVVISPEDEMPITVEIEATGVLEKSRWTGTVPFADTEYTVFPPLRWNYKSLVANKQAVPLAITYRVTMGDEEPEEKTVTVTLRSINDCPFVIVYGDDDITDVSYMFAAYVNEQHPFVDKVLREALSRGIVDSFTGYQSNDPKTVLRQVYAIWDALSQRDVRYSDITASAAENQVVASQHVRLIDESIDNAQANCVDGSVLLASILRKINIEPALVLVPGHCYLSFALDAKRERWIGLETTLIGNSKIKVPADPEADKIIDPKYRKEPSWNTFRAAIATGSADLEENRDHFDEPKDAMYRLIFISQSRQMGILPIAFDSAERSLGPAKGPK